MQKTSPGFDTSRKIIKISETNFWRSEKKKDFNLIEDLHGFRIVKPKMESEMSQSIVDSGMSFI